MFLKEIRKRISSSLFSGKEKELSRTTPLSLPLIGSDRVNPLGHPNPIPIISLFNDLDVITYHNVNISLINDMDVTTTHDNDNVNITIHIESLI